ncbi:MAG: MarP family serine protease [Candidatus Limnocylindrales bacterium]
MNLVDVIVIAVLVFAVVAGVASGAFPQLGGLTGAVAGGVLAIAVLLPAGQAWLGTLDPPVRAVVVLVGLVGFVALGEAIGSGLGARIRARLVTHSVLGTLDRAAGGLLGLAQGILVVWLVGGALAAGPIPQLSAAVQRSAIVRGLAGVLPPPTEVVGELGKWLDSSGLPDVFVGLEPFPAPIVDPPSNPQADAIAARAEASTVLVRADACGYVLSGTGFVVRPGYLVTNAHVVAGSRSVEVGRDGGSQADASVVLFDPELDVALLYAPGLAAARQGNPSPVGPALAFAGQVPPRGTLGAAIGHPGGGAMAIIPSAVTATYRAEGRDIYGGQLVNRQIIELRAGILQGDSGGPLVLADGTVGGVVFAQAQTDPHVGYALSPVDVAARIQPGLGQKTAVDTGACTR